MYCEKCGKEYVGGVCPNGCNAPQKEKKPIYKKWWFWAVIVVLIVAVFGGDGESTDNPNVPTGNKDNTTPSTTVSAAVADSDYHVGDVIDANGLKITYVKAEKWIPDNMYFQPDEGYMYIRLYLSVENTANSDRYISAFEFTCYADGKKEQSSYIADDQLEGGTLSSGRKDEGYIYFIVSEKAEEIEVEYETNFWSNKKAILKVELDG